MTDVKKELLTGAVWTSAAKYSNILVQLGVTAVLSRLLLPEDFGVVAVTTVIVSFFAIFSDLGIAPAIVQKKELTHDDLSRIFTFTLLSGGAVTVVFFLLSGAVAAYYDAPVLRTICRILCVNLLFAALNIVPGALLYKERRFRFIALRTLAVQFTAGAAAVAAAFAGAGVYALTVTPVVSSVVLFAVNYRQHPLPLRLPDKGSLGKVFSFSAYQFFFNILNYFTRNLDNLLIGRYMGLTPLGYYEKSYRLMMLPLQQLTYAISPVMHPVFSDFRHNREALSANYLRVVRLLAFIGFPLAAFLFFAAPELILVIFGDQWLPSVPVFRILALSVGVQIILSTSGAIFQAADSTRMLFLSGLLSSVLNVAAILTGIFLFGTLEAVAACIVLSFGVNFVQSYWLLYRRTLRLAWGPFWRQLLSPLLLTGISCIPLLLLSRWLAEGPLVLSLLCKGAAAAAVFAAYIQLSGEYDLLQKFRNLCKRQPGT